ncbi:cysteine proteinase [Cylindrobasidium torrendii FP15055 ss-10]|uniref:Cysteine proteinase n=1 Tax=Cylindrobasidium torrendii FP15055 ss-10 TaxID=1314674 RepID=A0A0D7BT16_9AGAR|nr:cysteine proteinase [Cylindrobasidium torrendii FP15055 ss-10]
MWPTSGKLRDDVRIKKRQSEYTPEQVSRWLEEIEFPEVYSAQDIAAGLFPTTFDNMKMINRLHIVKYPYENTEMHYTADHDMTITFDALYRRIVGNGKGSYCFGMNLFFREALIGLGYRVYSGAARINEAERPGIDPEKYTSFVHMVLFVQPGEDTKTYIMDVGCGGSGPSQPILLSANPANVTMGVSPTEHHRLVLTNAHSGNSSIQDPHYAPDWALLVQHSGKPEAIVYAFTEAEFFAEDYDAANFVVSKRPSAGSLFWENVVVSRHFWLTREEAEELGGGKEDMDSPATRYIGRIGLKGDTVRRHVGTGSEVLAQFETEKERGKALRTICNLFIGEEDLHHIQGRTAALTFD